MTPLELLAVGVIVVLVWCCGVNSHYKRHSVEIPIEVAPVWIGSAMVIYALVWLLILGIKEAAK